MRALPPLLLALALLTAPTPRARGFSVALGDGGQAERWATPLVSYWLELAGSDNLAPEAALEAVRRGFQSWVAVGCAALDFEEKGDAPDPLTTLLASAPPNGKSELVWLEGEDWTMGAYVLGVTSPLTDDRGVIIEADIAFNGGTTLWTVSGEGGTDLESVAVHEIGHMFGLQHNLGPYSLQQPPTMATTLASANKSRTLEADDIAGVCFLYPASGVGWRCASDDDCPWTLGHDFEGNERYDGRLRCDAEGRCGVVERFLAGQSGLGEVCGYPGACAEGLWCQPQPSGEAGICTLTCDPAAPPCAEGFVCEAFEDPFGELGACLPADGRALRPGAGPWGCQSGAVCDAGLLCLSTPAGDKKLCTALCRVGEEGSCPEGEVCWSYGRANGGCFDEALIPRDPDAEREAEPGPEPSPEPEPEAAETSDEGGAMLSAEPERPARRDEGCDGGGGPLPLRWWWLLVSLGWLMARGRPQEPHRRR